MAERRNGGGFNEWRGKAGGGDGGYNVITRGIAIRGCTARGIMVRAPHLHGKHISALVPANAIGRETPRCHGFATGPSLFICSWCISVAAINRRKVTDVADGGVTVMTQRR